MVLNPKFGHADETSAGNKPKNCTASKFGPMMVLEVLLNEKFGN